MVDQLNNVRFGSGVQINQISKPPQRIGFMGPNKLLRQPITDEVAFTGGVLKVKDIVKAARALGLEVVENGGKHSMQILGKGRPIPVPTHGSKEIAIGTGNAIAKQLGFNNARDLLTRIK